VTRLDILSRGEWTPVLDCVVAAFGSQPALVLGALWRYEQMRDGFCRASVGTLAAKTGLSARRVRSIIRALRELGYVDFASGGPGRPNRYRLSETVTERLNWLALAAARRRKRADQVPPCTWPDD
jgi:DNA-binding IclR family transcriptional regulator